MQTSFNRRLHLFSVLCRCQLQQSTNINALASCRLIRLLRPSTGVKVRVTDCSLSVMELVLFLMLYRRLRLPKAPRSTQTLLQKRTQRASHLHRRRSVPFYIRYDSFGVQTVAGAGWMFRERAGEVESVPSALSRGCTRGARHVLWRDRRRPADEHAVPSPQKQWHASAVHSSESVHLATLVGQPVLLLPSVTRSRAANGSVWHRTCPPPPKLCPFPVRHGTLVAQNHALIRLSENIPLFATHKKKSTT